jgi:GntR family histidine utilization transcriptional repressor
MPAAAPRYLEIRRDLEARILSGEWPPGFRIPSEHELTEQFRCSRMTVNKAVSALAQAGLLVRKRRSGSFVAAPHSQETVLEIHDIKREVVGSGKPYRHRVLTRRLRQSTREDRARLGLEEASRVIALTVVHDAGERPFVFEDRVINLQAVPKARPALFEDEPPGTWLLAHIPWSQAEHRIRAVAGPSLVTTALDIPVGSPCLLVERCTWHAGLPVTHVLLYYPGASHELVARFSPTT